MVRDIIDNNFCSCFETHIRTCDAFSNTNLLLCNHVVLWTLLLIIELIEIEGSGRVILEAFWKSPYLNVTYTV